MSNGKTGRPAGSKSKESHALAIIRRYHPEVKTIRDAQRSIHIEVSGRYLRGAKPAPDQCPLAKACVHEMELDGALISRGVCYTIRGAIVDRYVPGGVTREMLRKFDKTGDFVPGIYKLAVPPPSQALGARSFRSPSAGKKTGTGPLHRHTYLNGERRRLQ